MRRSIIAATLLGLLLAGALGAWLLQGDGPRAPREHLGAFQFESGEPIVFAERSEACLRYVFRDGEAGHLCPGPGQAGVYDGAAGLSGEGQTPLRLTFDAAGIAFGPVDGPVRRGARISLETVPVEFQSDGIDLYGELLAPPGDGAVPLIIQIGGSERTGAVTRSWTHPLFAANGVASFVYDKRGVGASDGAYTQDFHQLARDAAAAIGAAREVLGTRASRVGLIGYSQGGWVGPLAASQAEVDFVIVAFGLAVTPAEEEIAEVANLVRAAGFGDAAVADAELFAAEAVRLADTDFAASSQELERLKALGRRDGWLDAIRNGGLTSALAANPVMGVRLLWGLFDADTSWGYDPRAALSELEAPQLWLIGGRDVDAPPERTLEVLAELQSDGADLEVLVFEQADHGMVVAPADGAPSRYAAGYAELIAAFAHGRER